MGLFNRKNPYEKDVLDMEVAVRASPERPELKARLATSSTMAAPQPPSPQAPMVHASAPQAPAPVPPSTTKPSPASYTIEDAIQLMRELPDNKKEMVIAIVQKTLLSAKVNVGTILDDATRKIERLERKNDKLIQEVRELEEAILQRKAEVDSNTRDIAETREVKISFEAALKPSIHELSLDPLPFAFSPKAI